MDRFIGGWYTFITGNGINFVPSTDFYNNILLNKINYCNTCYILSKKEIINTCKVYCIECQRRYM